MPTSPHLILEGKIRVLLLIGFAGFVTAALISLAPAQDLRRIFHAIAEPDEALSNRDHQHRRGFAPLHPGAFIILLIRLIHRRRRPQRGDLIG